MKLFILSLSAVLAAFTTAASAGSNAFSKADPKRAFSELKIYDAQDNPVRTPKEDWEGAKSRVSRDPVWIVWLAKDRDKVDKWMATRQDKVEWVAGWYHDFVSPKDGSFLIYTPDEPGPETLHSASDPKVELTLKLHGAWVYLFRGNHAGYMLEAARLYRLTGDPKYAEWSAAQLDFYADHYLQWPVQTKLSKARLMGQSLDEAVNLITYVQVARTLGGYVTPERKQAWMKKLFKPEAALLQETMQTIHNIACWQRSAVGCVALYCGDDALWKQAVEGPNGIRDQIARGVTSDYLWYEQSLSYNAYVVQALEPFFSYALMEGRGQGLESEMETVENLMLAPIQMRFPTGQLPNPADSLQILHAPDISTLGKMAELYPTRLGATEMAKAKNWLTLLDPPEADGGTAELPSVSSTSLESSRMAILHVAPWQVYFHYGQLAASHAQAEALNFEAFYDNIDVTHDPGTTGYGSPMTPQYYRTGLCHNVPLVDGQGQESWNPGQLDKFTATSVSANQPKYRSNASASTSLSIDGNRFTQIESVTTSDGKPHALGFVLHLQGIAQLPPNFHADATIQATHPLPAFGYLTNVTSASGHDQTAIDVQFGSAKFHVTLTLPGDFTIWHASAPDVPPKRNDVFFIETHGTTATMTTTIEPVAN